MSEKINITTPDRIGPKTRDLLATLLERPSYHHRAAFTPLEMKAALAEGDAWLVPPVARPVCPLSQKPCTSWSCLQDVCATPDEPQPMTPAYSCGHAGIGYSKVEVDGHRVSLCAACTHSDGTGGRTTARIIVDREAKRSNV